MRDAADRLDKELHAAGLPIVGVSIGNVADTSTWRVHPESLQAQAQPIIDAIDLSDWERDEHFVALRAERNQRLLDSDWTMLSDVAVEVRFSIDLWRSYRQHLRDLPATTSDPTTVLWPTPPA
jgi:hypothetical protein